MCDNSSTVIQEITLPQPFDLFGDGKCHKVYDKNTSVRSTRPQIF